MTTLDELTDFKRRMARKYRIGILSNNTLLEAYRQLLSDTNQVVNPNIIDVLRRRKIRTLSGVAVVTVLTKPHPCPGTCVYCPTEARMPKSYLASEPAAQRALGYKFDPYRQVAGRIAMLHVNGHLTDKIELIVLGGTWSAYPKRYQAWFIKRCFDAANGRVTSTLTTAQKLNERAPNRIIGLSLETRPDWITPIEVRRLRDLGVTRIQLGVQSTHNDVLKLIRRGHTIEDVMTATRLLKDAGFKINYHLMPGLPGSNFKKDIEDFDTVFGHPGLKPDFIKLYPTLVIKSSALYQWWKSGKYKPYTAAQLLKLVPELKKRVPRWVRIERLVRDIPGNEIEAGSLATNLRQMLQERGVVCQCIRCREARNSIVKANQVKLWTEEYQTDGGRELFITFEDKKRTKLYAFCRLRLPSNPTSVGEQALVRLRSMFPKLHSAALIRELHTYGQLIPLKGNSTAVQHLGFGKRLMLEAERVTKLNGYKKLAVISGIGVRAYYRKLGYRLEDTYMAKRLNK